MHQLTPINQSLIDTSVYKYNNLRGETMEYKLSTLKIRCKSSIHNRYSFELIQACLGTEGLGSLPRKKQALKEKVFEVIDNWDIRNIKGLIDLFPDCVAVKYQNQRPFIEYDDKGEWVVIFRTRDRSGDAGFFDRSY